MAESRLTWRHAALSALWLGAGLVGFLILVQAMLVIFAPFGHWQLPRAARVVITLVERDEEGKITGRVQAREGERPRILLLAKEEAAALEAEEALWILDNYFAEGARPSQFVLTPWRLLLEYPEPLLALLLWAISRLRKAQAASEQEDPDRPRTVWKDEFHSRARRFDGPADSPGDAGTPGPPSP